MASLLSSLLTGYRNVFFAFPKIDDQCSGIVYFGYYPILLQLTDSDEIKSYVGCFYALPNSALIGLLSY
jgi:hypothetical protein